MRICLLTKDSPNLLYQGTAAACRELGFECLEINISQARNEDPPLWVSIPTLQPDPHDEDAMILEQIRTFRPDVILLLQYAGLPFLRSHGPAIRDLLGDGKVGFWLVDLAESVFPNEELGQYIDGFFASNAGQLPEYKAKWGLKTTCFMPQGGLVRTPASFNSPKKHKVGFLGRRQREDPRYEKRNKLLDAFKESFDLFEADSLVSPEEMAVFYQECGIVLGTSWRNDVDLYSSDRIFNVTAAGGFYLCSYFPGIDRLFGNNRHVAWFETTDEGLRTAGRYLGDPEARDTVAASGHALAKEKHTYADRVTNIVDVLAGKTKEFSGFL